MRYFNQILFEMRHQKMMMWVSIGGTALSIFLVMAFYMSNHVTTAPVAPELDRARIVSGQNIEMESLDGEGYSASSALDYETARKLYAGLEGVEKEVFMSNWPEDIMVGENITDAEPMAGKYTDENYWKLYQFSFIDGKPYDRAACESGDKTAVISRSVARRLFGTDHATGHDIRIDGSTYKVIGVTEDVHPLLESAYADIWLPLGPDQREPDPLYPLMGNIQVKMLLEEGMDPEALRKQVRQRYASLNASIKEDNMKVIYHEQPYTDKVVATHKYGSNTTPDPNPGFKENLIIYGLLLILPAINLSSMTRGRLRSRESEIGVRRAFGASRSAIVHQLLGENFIITLIGGVIGFVGSFIFMMFMSRLFLDLSIDFNSVMIDQEGPRLRFDMLFSWNGFLLALGFCFVLNLLSAFAPAWKASRMTPAAAIARNRNN